MDLDGRDLRQLTAPGAHASQPAWSPGGDQVAYADGAAGARRIFVIGAAGAGARELTALPDAHSPAWSVRNRIAFVARNPGGDDIYTIGAGGGPTVQLTRAPGNDEAPSWSPDGSRIAYVRAGGIWVMAGNDRRARMVARVPGAPAQAVSWAPNGRLLAFSAGRSGQRRIYVVASTGKGLRALSAANSDGHSPAWQPTGFDPVVETAGDIACDPQSQYYNGGIGIPRHCGQLRTGNLLMQSDLWRVLVLGDEQYGDGALDKFHQSYDPSWGATKALQRPVPGNHEYATDRSAGGYFDYFDGIGQATGPAGSRGLGYYSYDIGAWHVVALNSNCSRIAGGCDVGSPEERWLAADLAAHPTRCALAYFHHPLFSSQNSGDLQMLALWQTLYDGGVDVILSGHHHYYDRFAPQDPAGDLDPAQGIREFIVGTGGMSLDAPKAQDPHSEVDQATTFGVLALTLHPGSYDWHFLSASADPFTDRGTTACH
jgi:hypothetical protein